jgi:ADP-ribose pyrophosphatase
VGVLTPAAQEIYRGRVVHLRLERAELPGHSEPVSLEIVRHPGAAAVVALDEQGRVALVHQFRHAAGGFIWEIPAGVLEPGEAPLACARRELEEETGLRAASITPLGSVLTAPGFCDERIHLFLATDLTEGAQRLEGDEVLSVSRLPLVEAMSMVARGDICDAKSIAGLHHAWRRLGEPGNS